MRKIIFSFILFFCMLGLRSFSQVVDADEILPIDPTTKLITFKDIVEVPNAKNILFKNAQTWIAKTYGDYKSVIQLEDKEEGKLIIKGVSSIQLRTSSKIKYTIEIDIKDNKYRAIITELQSGYQFNNGQISYTPFEKFKPKSVVINDYNAKIKVLEDKIKSSNIINRKTLTKELEQEKEYQEAYLIEYPKDRKKIAETVNLIFESLKNAMSLKDDF